MAELVDLGCWGEGGGWWSRSRWLEPGWVVVGMVPAVPPPPRQLASNIHTKHSLTVHPYCSERPKIKSGGRVCFASAAVKLRQTDSQVMICSALLKGQNPLSSHRIVERYFLLKSATQKL